MKRLTQGTALFGDTEKQRYYKRLAAYEDTGLTPEEIMEMKMRDEYRTPKEIKHRMCDGCRREDCEGCESYYNRCPSCNEGLDRDSGELFKYCPKCGQALSL